MAGALFCEILRELLSKGGLGPSKRGQKQGKRGFPPNVLYRISLPSFPLVLVRKIPRKYQPIPYQNTESGYNSTGLLLPPFLCLNSKITFEHDGQYHKKFLGKHDDVYWFVDKSHINKCKKDWGADLPSLPITWVDMCVEGVLVPGHVSHTFLHSAASPKPITFDPVASFVSAINLHKERPPTHLKALADSHPDCEVWLECYFEEKLVIKSLGTFRKITLGEYRTLCEKGAPRVILTMCVFTIKKDENLLPL